MPNVGDKQILRQCDTSHGNEISMKDLKGVTRMDTIRKLTTRDESVIKSILKQIESKLGWLGHLYRLNDSWQMNWIWTARLQKSRKEEDRQSHGTLRRRSIEKTKKTWSQTALIVQKIGTESSSVLNSYGRGVQFYLLT